MSAALDGSAEELRAWRRTLLASCVKWLLVSFSGDQQGQDGTQDQEGQMLLRFSELLVGVFPLLRDPGYVFKGRSEIDQGGQTDPRLGGLNGN